MKSRRILGLCVWVMLFAAPCFAHHMAVVVDKDNKTPNLTSAHLAKILHRLAEANGVALAFEASSAGGVPVVKTLREALAGNAVRRVYGILNGTCNYILSRMETEGLAFDACLADAQRLGYAEADPTFDVGGFDTAHKLAILASLAFGTRNRRAGDPCRGDRGDQPDRSRRRRRTRLSDQAARGRRAHRPRGRAARASDHGRQILADRAGHGRSQRGDDRRRCGRRADLIGAGAGGDGHRLGGRRRHRRHRARRRHAGVRPAGRRAGGRRTHPDAAPRGRLLHPPGRRRPAGLDGVDRHPHGRAEDFARGDHAESAPPKAPPPPHRAVVLITHATSETAIREALALALADGS